MSPDDLIHRPAEPASDLAQTMAEIGRRARDAASRLALAPAESKTAALKAAAAAIRSRANEILSANAEDLAEAKQAGIGSALLDRLALDPKRLEAVAHGLEDIAAQPDPVGRVLAEWTRPNGLRIARVSVPLGVIGIIYESRPNVTADAGGLALKSGNAAILRGGSESFHSSRALVSALSEGLRVAGLPVHAVQLVPTRDRAADAEKARQIVLNAKMRRVSICGATETLLVDRAVARTVLPPILADLRAAGCELRGDPETLALDWQVAPATEQDWRTEYLDAILAVRVVDGVSAAVDHINRYGSHHTDAIVTEDEATAERFLREVDSAIVLVNASTQFADGGEFGMGAEIGISTQRLPPRGPVGAAELTTYKYLVRGNGQVRP